VCPEKGVRTYNPRRACLRHHAHTHHFNPLAGTNSAFPSSATVPTPLALLLYNTYMYSRPQSALIKPVVVCPLLLACFHELPTEETFARTSGAHRTIRAHVRGFGLTPLTAGRYASAARLPSRLPNAPSRSHSHTLVCTTGAFNRAFPFDSRKRPHATCAASPSRG